MTVTIKYGDEVFYCEGVYDEVCKAIVDGKSLEVYETYVLGHPITGEIHRLNRRITFFQDVDYVSVEL